MEWAKKIVWGHTLAWMTRQRFEVVVVLSRLWGCDFAWGCKSRVGVALEMGE